MRLSKLNHFVYGLIYLMDKGYYNFSIAEIKQKIRDKSLFEYLKAKTKDDYFDISLLEDQDKEDLLTTFEHYANDIDEDRKLGVTKNGLCLLLAYTIALIQRKKSDLQDYANGF